MLLTVKKNNIFSLIMIIMFLALSYNLVVFTYKTISTAALPINNKIIVIDAGHGIPDGGAIGLNGSIEQQLNLKIAFKLQNLLEQSGAKVILTRADEYAIVDTKNAKIKDIKIGDIKLRKNIRDTSNCNIFISIHMNKFEQSKYKGAQVFYNEYSPDSKVLAVHIQNNLKNFVDSNNKRVAKSDKGIYILKEPKAASVLVECGFLSNSDEEILLNNDNYQNKIAYGIYHGINEYISEKNKEFVE